MNEKTIAVVFRYLHLFDQDFHRADRKIGEHAAQKVIQSGPTRYMDDQP
jgi:hypothetical protein